jgi:kynureninase
MKDLIEYRDEFPILATTTYLISNSLGAMPRGVEGALARYAESWATRGVRAWEDSWWELAVKVGDKIAPILGADPGTVALHENVTTTQAVIASCFRFGGPRRKVVLTDKEFPSVIYFWHAQRAHGAEIELVETDSFDPLRIPTEKILAAIDERTLLVPLSHVLFRTGYVQDAAAIIEKAHRVGAHVILDTYQSAGVLPVEVKKWDADFCVGGTLKWLCGGPGVAYLYVRPDLREKLQPTFTGWFAHPRPFDFEVGPNAYCDNIYRFLNGTPHIACFYAVEPGLDIIREVGVDRIRRRSLRITRYLFDSARERGWRVHTPESDNERGGTVTLDVPRGPEVLRELLKRDILIDYRPRAGIRVSPHFYNTEEECDRLLAAISEILAALA